VRGNPGGGGCFSNLKVDELYNAAKRNKRVGEKKEKEQKLA
jgi:hypothetical protein